MTLQNTNSPLENSITSLYADFQNKIWIGTLNSGMSAMRTDNRSLLITPIWASLQTTLYLE